ncbi:hypothetical protein cypCar_00039158 [Cyprinus carpio]|nr:hypothetical protein cypCar_00039158 [Cyprinus carpio]
MALIKEESEDIKIEDAITAKQEDAEEQTGLAERLEDVGESNGGFAGGGEGRPRRLGRRVAARAAPRPWVEAWGSIGMPRRGEVAVGPAGCGDGTGEELDGSSDEESRF